MEHENVSMSTSKTGIPESIARSDRADLPSGVGLYEPEVMVRLSTSGNRWCLGEAIRIYRLISHLSQTDISTAAGKSKSYVSAVEAGNQRVSHAFVVACAEALSIEADDIYRLAISHLETSDKDRDRSPKAAARHMLARFVNFVAENCEAHNEKPDVDSSITPSLAKSMVNPHSPAHQ